MWRFFRFAFEDLFRNSTMTIMTVVTFVLLLLSLQTLWGINHFSQKTKGAVEQKIDVIVRFVPEAPADSVLKLKNFLLGQAVVKKVDLLLPEQVLADFQSRHIADSSLLLALTEIGTNPFGAEMRFSTLSSTDYESLVGKLLNADSDKIIETTTFDDTQLAMERLNIIATRLQKISLAISLFFATVVLLMLFNTMRIILYTQKLEIGIKKLVGATDWFVFGPYIAAAGILSFSASIIATAIFAVLYKLYSEQLQLFFGTIEVLTKISSFHIISLLVIQFLFLFIFSGAISFFAVRRYGKV